MSRYPDWPVCAEYNKHTYVQTTFIFIFLEVLYLSDKMKKLYFQICSF